jgi:O-antigen/teichoic acid export membrane protein
MSTSPPSGLPPGSRQVASGAGTALLARAGGVVEIVSQPLYVWLFGLPTYGLYMVLWSAVNLVENFADLGMTSALQRVVPQAKDDAERAGALRQAMVLGLLPCILIALATSLSAQ